MPMCASYTFIFIFKMPYLLFLNHLLPQVVCGPAQHLPPVVRPRSCPVVAEAHAGLRRGDLEAGVAAVEQPTKGGRLWLGVNLAPVEEIQPESRLMGPFQ